MSLKRAGDFALTALDLRRIGQRFGIEHLEPIGGFENALFRSDDTRVVRVTHVSRRTQEMIRAELDFIAGLAADGVDVVRPSPTVEGDLVLEYLTEGEESVLVMAMSEAPGKFKHPDDWEEDEIAAYGRLIGSMHESASRFGPATGPRRPPWHDPIFDPGVLDDSGLDQRFLNRYKEILTDAKASPGGGADLLIHQDAHLGNLFIDDRGAITVFDFDDCAYGTAVHDVAIVLFYWTFISGASPQEAAQRFIPPFLSGYKDRATLPDAWAVHAEYFLSLREIEIFWLLSQEAADGWRSDEERFMDRRKERVLSGTPYLGTPLAELVG